MQDRFKFRAWNFDNKKYFQQNKKGMFILDGELPNGTSVGVSCSLEDLANSNNYGKKFIIEQCTGVKDKNGKLIYEGDIVEYNVIHTYELPVEHNCLVTKRAKVIFESGCFYPIFNLDLNDVKVIGNIHENPELLEE